MNGNSYITSSVGTRTDCLHEQRPSWDSDSVWACKVFSGILQNPTAHCRHLNTRYLTIYLRQSNPISSVILCLLKITVSLAQAEACLRRKLRIQFCTCFSFPPRFTRTPSCISLPSIWWRIQIMQFFQSSTLFKIFAAGCENVDRWFLVVTCRLVTTRRRNPEDHYPPFVLTLSYIRITLCSQTQCMFFPYSDRPRLQPWRRRQHVPPWRWYLPINRHGVTSQKTNTSNLCFVLIIFIT